MDFFYAVMINRNISIQTTQYLLSSVIPFYWWCLMQYKRNVYYCFKSIKLEHGCTARKTVCVIEAASLTDFSFPSFYVESRVMYILNHNLKMAVLFYRANSVWLQFASVTATFCLRVFLSLLFAKWTVADFIR